MSDLPYTSFLWAAGCCSLAFSLLWWLQLRTSNANPVDVAWAAAIGTLAVYFALAGNAEPPFRWLLALMPLVWSVRLALHIFRRSLNGPEDSRYAYLRAHWKDHTQLKFFWFYQFQALTVMVFSFQFFVLNHLADPSVWLLGLACVLWLTALFGEAVADYQLSAWRGQAANAGKTCRVGLWRYSRHPNYFFEWLHWLSYVPLAVGTDWWWLPLLTQALMLATLLFGTGIPHAERQALLRRGNDYREYQQITSAFLPLPPRKIKP